MNRARPLRLSALAFFVLGLVCLFALPARASLAPALPQDRLVQQAIDKIAGVEAALESLAPGDVATARRLIRDIQWANKRLKAAYKKDTSHWNDAARRLRAADKAVRARAAAKPAPESRTPGSKAPGNKTPGSKTPGTGKASPESPAGKSPAPGPVVGERFAALQQLNKEVNNGFHNLRILNKALMGDSFRRNSTAQEIAKLKARLAKFPSADKNVRIVAGNLANFEKLFRSWTAEFDKDAGSAAALEKHLEGIAARYTSKSVPGRLYWPFDDLDKLRIWAARSRKVLETVPADLAELQKASAHATLGRQAQSLHRWVQSIPKKIQDQITSVQQQCDGAVADSLRLAKDFQSIELGDRQKILSRVLGEGALDRSMGMLQKGFLAVDRAATLDLALERKDAPDRRAQRKEIEDSITKLRALAKSAVAEVRMPRAAALDDADARKLSAIAKATLAKKKYATHPLQRLVITSKPQRKEKKEGTIRGTTTGATITTYHYVWDEFRVVTAEKLGDELWVFSNVLKYYHSSDTVTPQGEWILSRRYKSTRILPENVDR